jgi:hypothetical protein
MYYLIELYLINIKSDLKHVQECYTYSFVMSVDHFPCGNESQFEKWWQDRKQNPVEVTYPNLIELYLINIKSDFKNVQLCKQT